MLTIKDLPPEWSLNKAWRKPIIGLREQHKRDYFVPNSTAYYVEYSMGSTEKWIVYLAGWGYTQDKVLETFSTQKEAISYIVLQILLGHPHEQNLS